MNRTIFAPLLALIACASLSGCFYNARGINQKHAQEQAEAWVKDLGPAYEGTTVKCKKHDSDHDGDITCNVTAPDGERITIECPIAHYIEAFEDEGCRETLRYSGKAGVQMKGGPR